MFALAVSSLAFGLGPLAEGRGRRLAVAAVLVGVAALVIDIYLY